MSGYSVLTRAIEVLGRVAILPGMDHAGLTQRANSLQNQLQENKNGFPNAYAELQFLDTLTDLDQDMINYKLAVQLKYQEVLREQLGAIQSKVVEELNSNYPDLGTLAQYYSLMASIRTARASVVEDSWIDSDVMSMELQMLDWLKH